MNADGFLLEIKAWQIPLTIMRPEGYKYSMVYIDPLGLGYDNAHNKGHHRHYFHYQATIEFISIEILLQTFLKEVKRMRGEEA